MILCHVVFPCGIWLMPIHPSSTYHKYDVNDYYAIAPEYLGHSDIQTTSNIYTHLSWDDKTETLEAMEKAVKLPEFGGTKSAWDSVKMPKTS